MKLNFISQAAKQPSKANSFLAFSLFLTPAAPRFIALGGFFIFGDFLMKKQQRFTRNAIALACATFSFCASNVYAASTLQKNADGTTYDTATGLTWKRCMEGQTWDGTTCTGTAATYTFDAANALTGKVTFAGQSDWRMPNIRELLSISIDTKVFPGNPMMNSAWSSTIYSPYKSTSWEVYFGLSLSKESNRSASESKNVRLVRGGASTGLLNLARSTTDYIDNGDGTVTHTPTQLMWQHCMVGQNWSGNSCTGTLTLMPWKDAKVLTSSFVGQSDWRLPTRQELLTLVDYTKSTSPAVNTSVFPNFVTGSEILWSSSFSTFGSSNSPSVVNFDYGQSYEDIETLSRAVKLVRNTTPSDTNCFFDWAEARLPNLLTPHQTTQTAGTISYRGAYTSGMYIGVTGDSVLALGGSFGNTATTIGTLSSFLPTARAASCK